MDKDTIIEVTQKLTGRCYPYGDTSIDKERYENLLLKIAVASSLIDEVYEAGKLYNRHEYSIEHISNKANQYLTELRDLLCEIDYLPPVEPKPVCEDVISRQEAIHHVCYECESIIRSLPPVTPTERTGAWAVAYLDHESFGTRPRTLYCSNCNWLTSFPSACARTAEQRWAVIRNEYICNYGYSVRHFRIGMCDFCVDIYLHRVFRRDGLDR